jgi:hypothetical protein
MGEKKLGFKPCNPKKFFKIPLALFLDLWYPIFMAKKPQNATPSATQT